MLDSCHAQYNKEFDFGWMRVVENIGHCKGPILFMHTVPNFTADLYTVANVSHCLIHC